MLVVQDMSLQLLQPPRLPAVLPPLCHGGGVLASGTISPNKHFLLQTALAQRLTTAMGK